MSTNGVKGSPHVEFKRALDLSGRATPRGTQPEPRKKKKGKRK
jgi:hypothetical protein